MKVTAEHAGNLTGRIQAASEILAGVFACITSNAVEKHMRDAQRSLLLAMNEVQKLQRAPEAPAQPQEAA